MPEEYNSEFIAQETKEEEIQLLTAPDIRALAEELGVSPTKKLGQNFVLDPNTVRKIVSVAELNEKDHVVEIGPGLGSLTLALMGQAQSVTAVEIDSRLAQRLASTCAQRAPYAGEKLNIIEQDALTVKAHQWEEKGLPTPTALVANLPYNISVPVLLHFLAEFPSIRRVLVMVQLEVAQRLSAQPGSKIYGVPSVKASYYGTVSLAGTIGKNVFWPAPKVDSGLVRMDCYQEQSPWPQDPLVKKTAFELIDAAFLQRRKTLRSALSKLYGSAAIAGEALNAVDISPSERGEKITIADFMRLAEHSRKNNLFHG